MVHNRDPSIRSAASTPRRSTDGALGKQAPAILLMAVIFLLNFTGRVILAPLLPTVEADLGITHAQAGLFFLFLSAGYLTAMTGAGHVSARLTHHRTIVLSFALLGLSALGVARSSTLSGMRFGTLAIGLGAGLYLPSAIATITSLVARPHWGRAISIHELAPNTSFIAVPLLAELLLRSLSWRSILAHFGFVTFLAAGLYALLGRGGKFPGEPPALDVIWRFLKDPMLWAVLALFIMGVATTLGVFTMLPLYLVSARGLGESWANTLVGLSRGACPVLALMAGWAADRFGVRRTLSITLALSGVTTAMVGLVPDSWMTLAVFIQPMMAVGFFPAGFTALSALGDMQTRGTAVSLVVPTAFVVGGGGVPWFLGLCGDLGAFDLGFVGVGIFTVAGAWVALRYKPRHTA